MIWCWPRFFEFVRRVWSVSKILRFRNDITMERLYLSHGVGTIWFYCHPCKLVISWQVKMNHILIFSPPAFVTCIYNSFWWVDMVSLVNIAVGDVINIDFMHLHGSWKTFNWHQCGDSYYCSCEKNIIQKISARTTSWKILHLANFSNNKLLYTVILLLCFAKCFISVNSLLSRL